ncbi:hypothetical protein L209DRAFT_49492 [Thermothelomyces heterothallicus CBS 203.75]
MCALALAAGFVLTWRRLLQWHFMSGSVSTGMKKPSSSITHLGSNADPRHATNLVCRRQPASREGRPGLKPKSLNFRRLEPQANQPRDER